MCERSWVKDLVESQHLVSKVLARMHAKAEGDGQGWYNIADSMVDGVGLPDLGIGWEVTRDVLSMRIPGSQEKGEDYMV